MLGRIVASACQNSGYFMRRASSLSLTDAAAPAALAASSTIQKLHPQRFAGVGGKVQLLARYDLPAALLPTRVASGGWRRPLISARKAAELRKQSILMRAAGVPGVFDWDALDSDWRGRKVGKARHARIPNGRKHDSRVAARCVT